jgi:hypothetical protein
MMNDVALDFMDITENFENICISGKEPLFPDCIKFTIILLFLNYTT